MEIVGSFDAKTHLASLLERVGRGEEFLITKHGKPVARLIAPTRVSPAPDVRAVVESLQQFRTGRRLDDETIRAMIEEGRKS